jgi:hypothetical protein
VALRKPATGIKKKKKPKQTKKTTDNLTSAGGFFCLVATQGGDGKQSREGYF